MKNDQPRPTARSAKRPYLAPMLYSSESYERLALACTGAVSGRGNPPPVACTNKGARDGGCQSCVSS